jgi:acetyl esterase/lipase
MLLAGDCSIESVSSFEKQTKAVVLSVDYAKAPRYPYPHALLQCYDVLRWSMTSTAKEQGISVDPKRVIIQGNSAGGNLTAALSLLISFSDGPCAQFKQRLPSDFKQVLQVLLYPSLELTRSYSERLARTSNDKAREKSLPAWLAGMMEESYLPPHISKHQMFIAPAIVDEKLLRDLNLASALLLVGDHDCLLEENTMYAEKLKQTGKLVRSEVIAEGIHGFTGMQNTIGYKRSWDIVIEQIKEAIE